MNKSGLFINVILPLPIPLLYTYSIPKKFLPEIQPGKRVIVQFGKRKIYSAMIREVHNNKPTTYQTKDIISILDDSPLVNSFQFKFWDWIKDYYMCNIGEVLKAALPSGLKLESETRVFFNPQPTDKNITDNREILILNLLENRNMVNIKEILSLTGEKETLKTINSLLKKNAIIIEERIKEGYKPKYDTYVKLIKKYRSEKELKKVFDQLEKAPKQLEILMNYLNLVGLNNYTDPPDITKKKLTKGNNSLSQSLNTLVKKNIFEIYSKEVGRLDKSSKPVSKFHSLNKQQKKALSLVNKSFEKTNVVLLHGITSSGKTEIYIQLIDKELKKGKQVLFLLPEIALTTQIINRLKNVFGNKVGVYHSKFSDAERVEIWNNVQNTKENNHYQVILGVRSSVFLPFSNLGLIIIDEEHENSYKQYDPAPRYHARDSAIYLARLHNAKTILGTATPSLESYHNVLINKYSLVELTERYGEIELPEIKIVNTREAYRKKQMKSHFSPALLNNIEEALNNNEQVILFQNRRGFSPYLECEVCGVIPYCKNCNVSLTYHRHINQLLCHYCGYVLYNTKTCQACGNPGLLTKGFGTEKIEDEIRIFFPGVRISRMDLDTTRTRKSYEKIIADFEVNKTDILIGTQMISKGLDFDNVRVVGILNADNMLNFPDFRAFERSFQLMAQVSGRAGRKNKRGIVIIQTSNPGNYIIKDVVKNDFLNMYNGQASERKNFLYPPFCRLLEITLKHKNKDTLSEASLLLATKLRSAFGKRVLGPEFPLVDKIQNLFLKKILIKIEKERSPQKAKEYIIEATNQIKVLPSNKSLQVIFDVDPM